MITDTLICKSKIVKFIVYIFSISRIFESLKEYISGEREIERERVRESGKGRPAY